MTPFFTKWGQWGRINQIALCLVEFARWRYQSARAGVKSVILDCLVYIVLSCLLKSCEADGRG